MIPYILNHLIEIIMIILMSIAVVFAGLAYARQLKKKSLSYYIESITPLMNIKEGVIGDIEITHNGKPIEDVYLITIRFFNTGNQPIASDDYEEQIKIIHNKEAKVLSAEIYDPEPKNLELIASPIKNMVELYPVLLNAGDAFSLKIFTSKFNTDTEIEINGRIIGIKNIQEKSESKRQETIMKYMTRATAMFLSIGALYAITNPSIVTFKWTYLLAAIASFAAILLIIILFNWKPKELR